MSKNKPFVGKMALERVTDRGDEHYRIWNERDRVSGPFTSLFNVYDTGSVGDNQSHVICQLVLPIAGPGKPADLMHLTRGSSGDGEVNGFRPLVAGAPNDTGLFRMQHSKLGLTAFGAVPYGDETFGCWWTYPDLNNAWWWSIGWKSASADQHNRAPLQWSGYDTTTYTFCAADLRLAPEMRGLNGADYEWCDLSGEDYSHLSWVGAKFGNADLSGTDFSGCDLSGIDFRVVHSLKGAKFAGAQLDGANFSGLDMEGVDLSGASVLGADLSHTDLTTCVFTAPLKLSHDPNRRTILSYSKVPWKALHDPAATGAPIDLTTVILAYASLGDVPAVLHHFDATDADLRGVVLSGHDLRGAKFVHARAEAIDLSNCRLAGASFEFARLGSDGSRSASLIHTNLMDANFSNADLTGAILSGACLWGSGAKLEKATLVQTDFSNAYLAAADFRGIAERKCAGVNFSGACLVNANFSGTSTQHYDSAASNFVDACLQGTNFEAATLLDANLSNASVSFDRGTFQASVWMHWPQAITPLEALQYDATTGLHDATTTSTTCPTAGTGPCSETQLHIAHPRTHWAPPE